MRARQRAEWSAPQSWSRDLGLAEVLQAGGQLLGFQQDLSSLRGQYTMLHFYPVDHGYVAPTEFYTLESLADLPCSVLAVYIRPLEYQLCFILRSSAQNRIALPDTLPGAPGHPAWRSQTPCLALPDTLPGAGDRREPGWWGRRPHTV